MGKYTVANILCWIGSVWAAFLVSVIEMGGFHIVHFAKTVLIFQSSILGPLFAYLFGWPVWWANILLAAVWITSWLLLIAGLLEREA